MKTNDVWKRARRIPVMLITEGLCVGLVGGFVVLLYRVALTFAGDWLVKILSYMKGNPFRCVVWFLILAALAWIVGKLVKWEPMISGSGIPQVEGDYIASHILGLDPVFRFQITKYLPQNYYWLLILLGILVGVSGVFYNWGMLKAQELYRKIPFMKETGRLLIAFLTAGVLGIVMPWVLGSGSGLIVSLTQGEMVLGMVVLTLVMKFLFSAVSFGSGAPGGIFFPLLILGALIGAVFAMAGVEFFGLAPVYVNNFVLLGMTGFFTAIVRAPLTGIILLFEMSGSISQMLSLSIVSVTAYIVATLMRSEPIYDSLLKRILKADTIVHDK